MRRTALTFILVAILIYAAEAQTKWPTKGWASASPAELGLDPKQLAEFDADIAAGKYGYVDSMLVIRHGKIAFDRSYKHDYDRIYGAEAKKPGPLTLTSRRVLTTTSTPGGTRSTGAAIFTRCSR
jgi:hypothetical protein